MQTEQQKQDFVDFFGSSRYPRNLDYISLWFMTGARYIADGTGSVGFVSTNSVTQGDLVGLMWPTVLANGVEISFAYQSFKWANQARGAAGVTCVIIGLSTKPPTLRPLYSAGAQRLVPNISPYLRPAKNNTIVHSSRASLGHLPQMVFGNKPTDGGFLNFGPDQRDQMLSHDPGLKPYIRRYMGASELIKGTVRYCFWIEDDQALEALSHSEIAKRAEGVTVSRQRGSMVAQAMADRPYRFLQRAHRAGSAIVVPLHSSESRAYIPIDLVDDQTVVSNACSVIYGGEPWLFSFLSSRMHNVWVRAVCGRIKTDFRYSATLCYNTFPVAPLSEKQREVLSERAFAVLDAREHHSEMNLARLYDPEKMPADLRQAHQFLDITVDQLYRKRPFESDDERLELLFDMYEAATSGDLGRAAELEPADA